MGGIQGAVRQGWPFRSGPAAHVGRWAAKCDCGALRSYFDTNGDGKLTSADANFAKFKVLVSNADG